jgi:hypothetical protein
MVLLLSRSCSPRKDSRQRENGGADHVVALISRLHRRVKIGRIGKLRGQTTMPTSGTSANLRRKRRKACRVRATARFLGRESSAAILDVSEEGLRLYLRADIGAGVGSALTIDTEEFGRLAGKVVWLRPPHIGVDIGSSSNNAAKVESYFKKQRQA